MFTAVIKSLFSDTSILLIGKIGYSICNSLKNEFDNVSNLHTELPAIAHVKF